MQLIFRRIRRLFTYIYVVYTNICVYTFLHCTRGKRIKVFEDIQYWCAVLIERIAPSDLHLVEKTVFYGFRSKDAIFFFFFIVCKIICLLKWNLLFQMFAWKLWNINLTLHFGKLISLYSQRWCLGCVGIQIEMFSTVFETFEALFNILSAIN